MSHQESITEMTLDATSANRAGDGFFMLTPTIMARLAALKDAEASMIFLAIAQRANYVTRAWSLSEDDLAAEAGVSARTVRRKVPLLVQAGLIAVEATYWVDGQTIPASEIQARTGGRLVRSPNPKGRMRWTLVREKPGRDVIDAKPVGRGWNRYTVLLWPGERSASPKGGTASPQGRGQAVLRVGTERPGKQDASNKTKEDEIGESGAVAPPPPPAPQRSQDLDVLVDAFMTAKGGDPSRFRGKQRAQARRLFASDLPADVTAADITAAVEAILTDQWFASPGMLPPNRFVSIFADWEATGRPARVGPLSAKEREREERRRLLEEYANAGLEPEKEVFEVQPDGTVVVVEEAEEMKSEQGAPFPGFARPLYQHPEEQHEPGFIKPTPQRSDVQSLIPPGLVVCEDPSPYIEQMRATLDAARRKRAEREKVRREAANGR